MITRKQPPIYLHRYMQDCVITGNTATSVVCIGADFMNIFLESHPRLLVTKSPIVERYKMNHVAEFHALLQEQWLLQYKMARSQFCARLYRCNELRFLMLALSRCLFLFVADACLLFDSSSSRDFPRSATQMSFQ